MRNPPKKKKDVCRIENKKQTKVVSKMDLLFLKPDFIAFYSGSESVTG